MFFALKIKKNYPARRSCRSHVARWSCCPHAARRFCLSTEAIPCNPFHTALCTPLAPHRGISFRTILAVPAARRCFSSFLLPPAARRFFAPFLLSHASRRCFAPLLRPLLRVALAASCCARPMLRAAFSLHVARWSCCPHVARRFLI